MLHWLRANLVCALLAIALASAGCSALAGCAATTDGSSVRETSRAEAPANELSPVVRVHRAAFEELPGFLIAELGHNWWAAFNPRTGAVEKIWNGGVEWRGKVYDFSQESSRSTGHVAFSRLGNAGFLTAAELDAQRPHAEVSGVDLTPFATAYVAFDETGRNPATVSVMASGDQSPLMTFESSTSYTSDTEWMWNYRQLSGALCTHAPQGVIQFTAKKYPKRLRNIRVYGERIAWRDASNSPLAVTWRGYSLKDGELIYKYELGGTAVLQRVAALADGSGVQIEWTNVPAGTLLDGVQLDAPRRQSGPLVAKRVIRLPKDAQ